LNPIFLFPALLSFSVSNKAAFRAFISEYDWMARFADGLKADNQRWCADTGRLAACKGRATSVAMTRLRDSFVEAQESSDATMGCEGVCHHTQRSG
jgi:hypothetical protein